MDENRCYKLCRISTLFWMLLHIPIWWCLHWLWQPPHSRHQLQYVCNTAYFIVHRIFIKEGRGNMECVYFCIPHQNWGICGPVFLNQLYTGGFWDLLWQHLANALNFGKSWVFPSPTNTATTLPHTLETACTSHAAFDPTEAKLSTAGSMSDCQLNSKNKVSHCESGMLV